jgi:hypothetical protein
MSAFMVGNAHIDYLVTAIRAYRDIRYAYIPAASGAGWDAVDISLMDETEIGRMLLGTNLTSMMSNYEDRLDAEELGAVESYTYRRWTGSVSPVQTIKAVQCYQYQSMDYDGWKDSLAKSLTDLLKGEAIGHLPGYDQAAWEVTRELVTGES